MEKINVHLRKVENPQGSAGWGYSVIWEQGGRASEVYHNSAQIVGEAYVLNAMGRNFDAIAINKRQKKQRERVDSRLYRLALDVANRDLKELTPELIDETQKRK